MGKLDKNKVVSLLLLGNSPIVIGDMFGIPLWRPFVPTTLLATGNFKSGIPRM
jgi:hypothetical protein